MSKTLGPEEDNGDAELLEDLRARMYVDAEAKAASNACVVDDMDAAEPKRFDGLRQQQYTGELSRSGLRHGKGTLTYAHGQFRYVGEWREGVKHGRGALFFSADDFFEGDFCEGEICGQGTRRYADGSQYVGQWASGEREGEGELHDAATGSTYCGAFRRNQRHGTGTLTLASGDVFMGEFERHWQVKGVLQCANEDAYDGEFGEKGLFHGTGTAVWSTGGDVYVGQWRAGKRHGTGKFVDGVTSIAYDGEWADDVPTLVPAKTSLAAPEPAIDAVEEVIDAADTDVAADKGAEMAAEESLEVEVSPGAPWSEVGLRIGVVDESARRIVTHESGRVLHLIRVTEAPTTIVHDGDGGEAAAEEELEEVADVLFSVTTANGVACLAEDAVLDAETFPPGSIHDVRLLDATVGLQDEERLQPSLLKLRIASK